MQSVDIQELLLPRDNPGDATFLGAEQETLSAPQEKKMRRIIDQVRANFIAGDTKDLEKLFDDPDDPNARIFRNAIAKDMRERPQLYKSDIEENNGWGAKIAETAASAGKWVAKTAGTAAISAGIPTMFSSAKGAISTGYNATKNAVSTGYNAVKGAASAGYNAISNGVNWLFGR